MLEIHCGGDHQRAKRPLREQKTSAYGRRRAERDRRSDKWSELRMPPPKFSGIITTAARAHGASRMRGLPPVMFGGLPGCGRVFDWLR